MCGAAAQSPSNEYNLVAQAAEPFYVTDVGLAMLTMLPTMPTILTEPTMLTERIPSASGSLLSRMCAPVVSRSRLIVCRRRRRA